MSFSWEIKDEILRINEMPPCCEHAMAYGMLLFARSFNENDISLMTDNHDVAQRYADTIERICASKPRVSVSDAGKVTVSVPELSERKKLLSAFSNSGNEKFMRIDRGNLLNESGGNESETDYGEDEDADNLNCCNASFLRGAFLSCGTCSDPNKGYHIEFVAPFRALSLDLLKILTDYSLKAKHMVRRGTNVIYIKDSTSIEELLGRMGAYISAMKLMDAKIYKDVRNLTNRRSNFESANLSRTVGAAYEQVSAITKLLQAGMLDKLEPDLREVAVLRMDNPDSSLREIGEMCAVPLSRSAVNYRLKRLMEISSGIK